MKVLSPYSTGSPLIPLPPESTQQTIAGGEDTSPLQRMQSITNSLLAAAGQGFAAQQFAQQRPSKAVLPPITQQQFDHYSNLNTEEIVKRVSVMWVSDTIFSELFPSICTLFTFIFVKLLIFLYVDNIMVFHIRRAKL